MYIVKKLIENLLPLKFFSKLNVIKNYKYLKIEKLTYLNSMNEVNTSKIISNQN